MGIAYFADNDDSNKVYVYCYPNPKAVKTYEISTAKKKKINSIGIGGEIIPGDYDFFLGGAPSNGAIMAVNIPWILDSDYDLIMSKAIKTETINFNDGTSTYEAIISSDTGEPKVIAGSNYLEWQVILWLV